MINIIELKLINCLYVAIAIWNIIHICFNFYILDKLHYAEQSGTSKKGRKKRRISPAQQSASVSPLGEDYMEHKGKSTETDRYEDLDIL